MFVEKCMYMTGLTTVLLSLIKLFLHTQSKRSTVPKHFCYINNPWSLLQGNSLLFIIKKIWISLSDTEPYLPRHIHGGKVCFPMSLFGWNALLLLQHKQILLQQHWDLKMFFYSDRKDHRRKGRFFVDTKKTPADFRNHLNWVQWGKSRLL